MLFIAIGVVYIVLGMLYESYIHPITILSGLPSAGLGALVTLWLFGDELNVYSFVGLIMLVGIVKKNAIMQIDFALDAERHEGKSPRDAIFEGCLTRFRPIMMTTMAALLGTVPIALGLGAGGEARRPLAGRRRRTAGLAADHAYLTPVVYTHVRPGRGAPPTCNAGRGRHDFVARAFQSCVRRPRAGHPTPIRHPNAAAAANPRTPASWKLDAATFLFATGVFERAAVRRSPPL